MDEEQRRQADLAARTMFNVFPQGVGEQVGRGAQSLAQTAMGLASRFTNPLGTLASDIGAAREAVSGTRLIGRSSPMTVPPTPMTPVLPSGTPMTGFDIYPTTPQSIPQTAAATAPQPAASLVSPSVPAFPTTGMGLMGNQNIRPLPTEQIAPMTRMAPTLADRGNVSADITGMQGKTPIQTPYGIVYATAGQAQAERVAEMGGLPAQSARLANIGEQAQRNAAIAQMRERGAALGQQGIQRQEQFFTQKRAERDALRLAESEARAGGISSMDIMRARGGGPSTMAGIRSDFQNYQPQIGPMAPTSTLVANAVSGFNRGLPSEGSRPLPSGPLGPSGYALAEQQRMARGSSNPYSNVRAEQRRRTRDIARSQGLQPAYSRQIQEEQEDYFRRRGLM
jgi:hypothetical protein